MEYQEFIRRKQKDTPSYGFDIQPDELNLFAFEWQKRIVSWAVKRGRAALFCDTGLGKTLMQLLYAEQVVKKTGGKVLIHCPVGVRWQTKREAERFNISVPVHVADSQSEVSDEPGITITNYEKIHKFEPPEFCGVVLDESSILKSFTGSTKRTLCDVWRNAEYRLTCTATPSPNDHMELGNQAEFLGVMKSNEMLSRWFYNDTMHAGGYIICPHGESDFWRWVSTWACCVSMPSEVGGDDKGYVLPPLIRTDHSVSVDDVTPDPGRLFYAPGLTATTIHQEKRRSVASRSSKVAEVVLSEPDQQWIVWCDTNYESDELRKAIPGAVDLRGSESETAKEEKLRAFSDGTIRTLISKPSMCGFGLNWQQCSRVAFVGLSFSYEEYYQAIRRCWRFGQLNPVHVHIVFSDGENQILEANNRKTLQHQQMKAGMSKAVNEFHDLASKDKCLDLYQPSSRMELPRWIQD